MTTKDIISYLENKCEETLKLIKRAEEILPDNDGYFPGKLAAYESILIKLQSQDLKDSCTFYVLRNHWLVKLGIKLKLIKL
jgi:hypothetical protein